MKNRNSWTKEEEQRLMTIGITDRNKTRSEFPNRSVQAVEYRYYQIKNRSEQNIKEFLKREIIRNPGNLSSAFKKTAAKFGYTKSKISGMYYSKFKNDPDFVCFTIKSNKITAINSKNFNIKTKENKIIDSNQTKIAKINNKIKDWVSNIIKQF